ncbi:hypothetical protein K8R42_05135 [bacterium]|nr:hypothetical protein [bacterium]
MTSKVEVTSTQNKYLLLMQDGPKTTRDFMLGLMTSRSSVGKTLKNLRGKELVVSSRLPNSRGNTMQHELATPYKNLIENGLIVVKTTPAAAITDEEVMYAAILRNAGMTGQELVGQHRKVYPKRSYHSVSGIVDKARARKLCL